MDRRRTWPAGHLARATALLWSLPVGLVGVAGAFMFALLGWGSLQVVGGTLQVVGRGPLAVWLASHGWAAFTLGWTIWFWREEHSENPTIVAHEQEHVRQYLRLGPLMLLAYPAAGLYAHLRSGRFYQDNLFERAAREAARGASGDTVND